MSVGILKTGKLILSPYIEYLRNIVNYFQSFSSIFLFQTASIPKSVFPFFDAVILFFLNGFREAVPQII